MTAAAGATPLMSETGQTLGKYQVIREIARSNDIVYEAYDPLMNRRVALKELAMPGGLNSTQQEDRRNRFLREARAAGTLTHPNIVTVYEYGEEANRHYIAMEFLDGHTLRNELDTHGFLPMDRAIEVAKAVLQALEYAHSNGVIHRDIKPENIQLMGDGRIKITDFGIARLTFEPNLTMDGQVFGTPSYMSPEQVVGREIDARSDLFSVGVVLYEMISGQKPFAGDSVVSITYAIMNAEPKQPSQANYSVWQVLQTALDKSPALRYSSASEMRSALQEAERQSQAGPVLDSGPNANPYLAYAPPQTPAYNPYGQPPAFQVGNAPPVGNPYVNAPYNAPAPSYPFNPYQSPPPVGMPGSSPGFPPIPIYYPPPPRRPLISPEVKAFFGRMFIAFLVIGTILALAVVAVQGFSKAMERMEQNQGKAAPMRTPPAPVQPVQNTNSAPAQEPARTSPPVVVSTEPPRRITIGPGVDEAAAKEHFDKAMQLIGEKQFREARTELYEARKRLQAGSEAYEAVEAWIRQLAS